MPKITIDESIVRSAVRIKLNEDRQTSSRVNSIINKLYRVSARFNGVYRDMGWEHALDLMSELASVDGVTDFTHGAGEYHDYLAFANSNRPASRTYDLSFETDCGVIIDGILTCHSAGSMDDPFDRYDMTCQFWRRK